jgi:hypothetical protein
VKEEKEGEKEGLEEKKESINLSGSLTLPHSQILCVNKKG